ncbi:Metallo-dependent phosphatase-like protein [Dichotomopilus funicola]|uniref:Metallo-dependent phosphatase-like protein n=1 Tax=Dichotomopilus funicola TaxID=1934379 RepID=A0AAN6UU06_9PEZI|nr:Metallo-dependent phosphatase-like protein [Dichotomopilus funicola]
MQTILNKVRQRLDPRPQVQIMSDLHLEVGQQYTLFTFPTTAPFLILAGDIGRLIDYQGYHSFLELQVTRYKKVFLVLGNHEFYGLDYQSGIQEARRLAQEPSLLGRLVLLHRDRWDDPDSDLTILGCTLWSAIPEASYGIVETRVSDFKKIDQWTPQQHNTIHQQELAWLREQTRQVLTASTPQKRRLLIATHHAPCVGGTARPDQVSNPWSPAFATDLVDQKGWDGIKVWVFGHTHYSSRLTRNGIRLVSNQRGYVLPGSAAVRKQGGEGSGGEDFDPVFVVVV